MARRSTRRRRCGTWRRSARRRSSHIATSTDASSTRRAARWWRSRPRQPVEWMPIDGQGHGWRRRGPPTTRGSVNSRATPRPAIPVPGARWRRLRSRIGRRADERPADTTVSAAPAQHHRGSTHCFPEPAMTHALDWFESRRTDLARAQRSGPCSAPRCGASRSARARWPCSPCRDRRRRLPDGRAWHAGASAVGMMVT